MAAGTDRPIATILSDIVGNVQDIIRSEMRLAKTEVREELRKSGSAAAMTGLGIGMLGLSGLFVLLAAMYALSLIMPLWAAALIVAVGEGLMAAVFIAIGIRRFKDVRGAPKTAESMKENVEWARQLTR